MRFSTLLPTALALGAASASYVGFNYGSTFTDNSAKQYQDFVDEFNTAKQLAGTDGIFTSARLYTMVQAGTTSDPISALKAADDTDTSLLLGVWASAGDASFANELTALKSAISQYPDLASKIAGISVGSEDLYRISPTGVENESGVGVGPDVVTNYIQQIKSALSGSSWSAVPVGHVDTWTAWVNGSNSAVVEASDFIGVDAYPYFQDTETNSIENSKSLFNEAFSNTEGAAQGKPVWITETGWPVSGPDSNLAKANTVDAKTYWDEVGCPNFGTTNIWWYTLRDSAPTTPSPSFGVIGSTLTTTPLYDLSCSNITNSNNSSSSSGSASTTSSSGALQSGAGSSGSYSNTTYVTTINGQPTTVVSASAGAATGGSGSAATAGSGSGSGSGSGTSTGSSSSASVTAYTGSASATVKGSMAGILGAVAAAVMLL